MIERNQHYQSGHNVQTTVDAGNNLLIDYKANNTNNSKTMGIVLRRVKAILRNNNLTTLYGKGYHTGSEFDIADKLKIKTMVTIPNVAANSPNKAYNVENFEYCIKWDYNLCPAKPEFSKTICGKAIQKSEYFLKFLPPCADRYRPFVGIIVTIGLLPPKRKYVKKINVVSVKKSKLFDER